MVGLIKDEAVSYREFLDHLWCLGNWNIDTSGMHKIDLCGYMCACPGYRVDEYHTIILYVSYISHRVGILL